MSRLLTITFVVLSLVLSVSAQDDIDPVILENLERTELRVQELRQLQPTRDINRQPILPDALQDVILDEWLDAYTAEDAHDDVLFYATFGFMNETEDLRTLSEQLILSSQITGIYEPNQDVLYVLQTGFWDALSSILYARHYTMALQAHNFEAPGLVANPSPDQALAIEALIEGDAHLVTLLYTEWLLENEPEQRQELIQASITRTNDMLDTVPSILEHELRFPFEAGYNFVRQLYDENSDWRLVNLVYERPPLSTEHILHPTLYLLYEAPHDIELEPVDEVLEDEWVPIDDRALGEFYLRQHLRLRMENEIADAAAAGWGGDRFLLYAKGNQTALVWKLSWDTPTDAQEFNDSYSVYLSDWFGVGASSLDFGACWISSPRSACKAWQDDEIVIVIAPTEIAQKLMKHVLDLPETRIIG